MNEETLRKSVELARAYVEKIHPGADFGTGAWFFYLNNALSNIQITSDEYDKIMSLSKAIIIKWNVLKKPEIKILNEELLEKTVKNFILAESDDEKFLATVGKIQTIADLYSRKIGTQAEFGTQQWMEDLWRQSYLGLIKEDEYDAISNFVKLNKPLLCNDEESKDIQWGCLLKWIKELPQYHYETKNIEFTPKTADFFRSFLKDDKNKLSDKEYVLITLAFKDIEAMRRGEFTGSLVGNEDNLHKFNRLSLSLSIIFIIIGLILPGFMVCLENGNMGEDFLGFAFNCLGGLMVTTLFAGFIYYPLMITGSILLANTIARIIVYKDKEPEKDIETASRHSVIGASIGSAHIVGSWFNELKKPGWIKDSKRV